MEPTDFQTVQVWADTFQKAGQIAKARGITRPKVFHAMALAFLAASERKQMELLSTPRPGDDTPEAGTSDTAPRRAPNGKRRGF